MTDLLNVYNNLTSSSLEQIEKSMLLISSLVKEEIIDNDSHKQHMISICENNLVALNNSLIDNQLLFSTLNNNQNVNCLQDTILSYMKNNNKLSIQIDETKLLFDSICKKKFNNELKSEIDKRRL